MAGAKIKVIAVAVMASGMVCLLVLQHQRVSRLLSENADLRNQLAQMASLQGANEDLSKQLKAANDASQASEKELLRLRGQAARLRQLETDNAQWKSQFQHLDQQMRAIQSAKGSLEQQKDTTPSVIVTTNTPNVETIDLGLLEVDDGVPVRFDLGGGTNCVVTPKALSDGIVTMNIKTELTNPDGTTAVLGAARITTRLGQYGSISVGDRMIGLAVKFK
jgi:hypothetical protein